MYEKSYATPEEHSYRFSVFKANLCQARWHQLLSAGPHRCSLAYAILGPHAGGVRAGVPQAPPPAAPHVLEEGCGGWLRERGPDAAHRRLTGGLRLEGSRRYHPRQELGHLWILLVL